MYQKQIEQLVVLQMVDKEIVALESEIEQAPRELADLEQQLDSIRERVASVDERLDLLKQQQSKLDFEIEEDASRIKKSKNKLMMVANTKEYHAMMREMDSMEKLNRLREEEKVSVMEELERQREARKEADEEMVAVKTDYDAKKTSLDARLAEANKRLTGLVTQRNKAGKEVPPPILGRYEFIRSRMANPVIVPVQDTICQGCFIAIPPQTYNELQKGKQILSCPNCQRLIYWHEHKPEETEEVKAVAPKKAAAPAPAEAPESAEAAGETEE